jgi:serine/threonine protein kinase/Tol biopolymer transport system component
VTPARWAQIKEVFSAALETPGPQRSQFLESACGGDADLRAEVERLLAANEEPSLQSPAAELFAVTAELAAGDTVAHYRIEAKLGEGGMGVVYKARDSRLKRFVALKVLPPEKVTDPERKQRFIQEARSASALNHPNIVTVYDIDQSDGIDFIAMEYVEGKTLDESIGRKGLKLSEALQYAIQIADAMARAHAAGIVHRDLKPRNVMVTGDGRAKVLDFGLAKLTETAQVGPKDSTLTEKPSTELGLIVGTAAYMSPEQAEGKKVDARSDIFSFGALLYEMLTGRGAFRRDSQASTLAAILHLEPAPLPAGIPQELERVVARCLRKDPARRFQHMDDVKVALEELKEELDSVKLAGEQAPERPGNRHFPRAALAAAAFLVLATVGLLGTAYRGLRKESQPADLVSVPLIAWPGTAYMPTFSPDGNRVAFAWRGEKGDKPHIYIEQIGSGARPVQLTNGPADFYPAWSPDDKYIAFFRNVGSGYALMLVPSIGGPERKVADFPDGAGLEAWSPDSKWLAMVVWSRHDPGSIWLVSVSTGERRRLTTPPATTRGDVWPSISPDGRSIAFEREVTSYAFAPYVLKLSRDYRPEGAPREPTTMRYSDMGGMAWTADGREVVFSAGPLGNESLFRVPASGRHSPARLPYVLPNAEAPIISPARSRLAYVRGTLNENLWRLNTRTGERNVLVGSNGISELPQYSPDGRKIAFQSNRSGEWGVWTCDADGSNCVRLTSFGSSLGGGPRWSPDSQWIAFDSRVEARSHIDVMQADGGNQRRMTNDPGDDMTPSWSHDGRWIYFASNRTGRGETWKMPAAGGTAVQVTHVGGGPAFESADGNYVYYFKYSVAGEDPGPLFRTATEGGPEVQVLPRVAHWSYFAIAAKAIYFSPDGKTIQRLELSGGRISTLATVEKSFGAGLCVSPDETFVVWSQVDRNSVELMLVEGFR